ncbi:hypothetical protein D3C77_672690 [compost metagenome]
MPIRDARGKELMIQGGASVQDVYGVTRDQVAQSFKKDEVPDDIVTFLNALREMCLP